eukprot:GHVR01152568.1.p1 GENE.GHVR01152568.1~~GHVR01152568.1.p1  ORF type:complete len:164 (-),score=8.60 GHVR01152568.1:223-714(-)
MPFIAFAGLINGIVTYYVQRAFMLSGQTKDIVWLMVPPVALNIALNIILIPKFGLMGAVASTIVGYLMALVLSVLMARRHYPLPLPIRAAAEIAFACGVMAIAVSALPLGQFDPGFLTLAIKGSVGALTYVLTCYIINAAECRTMIGEALSRLRHRPVIEATE